MLEMQVPNQIQKSESLVQLVLEVQVPNQMRIATLLVMLDELPLSRNTVSVVVRKGGSGGIFLLWSGFVACQGCTLAITVQPPQSQTRHKLLSCFVRTPVRSKSSSLLCKQMPMRAAQPRLHTATQSAEQD